MHSDINPLEEKDSEDKNDQKKHAKEKWEELIENGTIYVMIG